MNINYKCVEYIHEDLIRPLVIVKVNFDKKLLNKSKEKYLNDLKINLKKTNNNVEYIITTNEIDIYGITQNNLNEIILNLEQQLKKLKDLK